MKLIFDLTGKRFGRLLVESEIGRKRGRVLWRCLCDCGNHTDATTTSLKKSLKQSCGCLAIEGIIKRSTKHGLSTKKEVWKVWEGMIARCTNQNNISYKNYGARGISVCERWLDIENFYQDMGDRPKDKSLDRKDNNLGYFKENCYWASKSEQAKNTRKSKIWFIKNKIFYSSTDAAKYFSVTHQSIMMWCKNKKIEDCYAVLRYEKSE
jgi:hypothetical protein